MCEKFRQTVTIRSQLCTIPVGAGEDMSWKKDLILVGDFNCDIKEGNSSASILTRKHLEFLINTKFKEHHKGSTRTSKNSQTLTDLCIANTTQKV